MRPQPDQPRRPSRRARRAERKASKAVRVEGRGRIVFGVALIAAFLLLISLRGLASFYTGYLWFDSIDLSSVWRHVLVAKASLTLAGGAIFFLLCWGNLLIAERLAPVFRPPSADDDLIERYHEVVGRRAWLVRFGAALFMALVVGINLGTAWNEWILFTNRVDFGQQDATFHTDIGFYVFQLPFLTAASSWLFSSLVVIFVMTVLSHIVNGGIRFNTQLDRVTPQVKAHLSVLLGILALVQTGRYWLSRYDLTFSTRGTVDGATYTDVNVKLRAIYLLMLIALFAFGLFIANIWRRGWILPGMAVGLWALVAVVAGAMVPAFVQRFRVQPTESAMERPYITNNIKATRDAYGLSDVDKVPYDWTQKLDAETINANLGTMANVRLWDPGSMQSSFRTKQQIRPYYAITDVDVDRYVIDGKVTQVMIAARDLNPAGIQRPSWESTHLIYTNGVGLVAATANDKTSSGDPNLVAKDLPVEVSNGMPSVKEPRIYFGENKGGYVIVNTDVREPGSDSSTKAATRYTGKDGIRIGTGASAFFRKAAFSLRFGDVDPLVSGSIRPDSRVLVERDVTERLTAIAPFLSYDHDPYLVVSGGRLQYVVDAFTTTNRYPNAQRADTGGISEKSGLYAKSFNYARNSVKAVVDAYDGTVKLYVVDTQDPIIRAYRKAFPDLFTSVSKAPEELRDHLRYPEDLFTVQTQMWATYHVDNADDFYNGRDDWAVPKETGATKKEGNKSAVPVGPDGQALTADDRYPSQYVLMQLPGADQPSFVLLRPYVTATDNEDAGGQNQLRAWIVAESDPASYGKLRTYVVDSSDLPEGPNLAADDIKADRAVTDTIKSQCPSEKTCTFNAPSIVPVGNSLMYVQSFLVSGSQQGAAKLEYVIVNYRRPGESVVAIDATLHGALVQIFGPDVSTEIEGGAIESPVTDPGEAPPGGQGTLSEQETRLIDAIVQAFEDADAAARKGNQVLYAQKIAEAGTLADQLQELRAQSQTNQPGGGSGSGSNSTSTTTTTTTTAPKSTTTTAPKVTTTTSAGT